MTRLLGHRLHGKDRVVRVADVDLDVPRPDPGPETRRPPDRVLVVQLELLGRLELRLCRVGDVLTGAEEAGSRAPMRRLREDERRLARLPRDRQRPVGVDQLARVRIDLQQHVRHVLLPLHQRRTQHRGDHPDRRPERRPLRGPRCAEAWWAGQGWLELRGRRQVCVTIHPHARKLDQVGPQLPVHGSRSQARALIECGPG